MEGTKRKSRKTEVEVLMPELKRKSCCCGATESNPCACMKKGIMKCSAKEPMCQCYKDLKKEGKHPADMKKSFDIAWNIAKDDGKRYRIVRNYFSDNRRPRTIKSGLSLEEAQAHCRDPATSNADAENPEDRWFDGYEEM